ncbi:MAG TPA: UbiD family decarboxylase [Hyphomicrobiaceae bacterium]|nr:UbiD family decarboxylase [Hyphomicrobiaceae bacterium]
MHPAGARPVDASAGQFELRGYLHQLASVGLLSVHDGPCDLADVAATLDGNERAVLFSKVGPEQAALAGNVAGSRERLALAFGTDVAGLLPTVLERLRRTPGTREVAAGEAPVQEVVLRGSDADLTNLPVHLQHGLDGAPYISSSMDIVLDPRTGMTNVGIRRLMLRGRREAGIDLVAPSDLKAIYEYHVSLSKPLPIAFVIGSHPVDHVAATMRIPVDEVGLIASLRNEALPVVKCVTSELRVPADAEYIIEGYLDPAGHVEAEGPYGEFLGYYGGVKMNPVFHLTAVTHRRDPIFQTSTIAGRHLGLTDSAQLIALRTEVSIWRALETAVRELRGVYATTSSGGMFNVRISMRQRVPGEARNAIAAAFGSLANIKHVFVFDPDIDIFSEQQVDWALATRFQADRDLVVQAGMRTLPLDPSLAGARTGAKAGFDCTMPVEVADTLESQVPKAPDYAGERFGSLTAALQDGPKTFEQLMAATGSRDGREIVRALDDLRAARRLGRTGDGKWMLRDPEGDRGERRRDDA